MIKHSLSNLCRQLDDLQSVAKTIFLYKIMIKMNYLAAESIELQFKYLFFPFMIFNGNRVY